MARFLFASAVVLVGCTRMPPAQPPAPADIHQQLLTLDTHLDTPIRFLDPSWDFMSRHSVGEDLSQVDYPRMLAGGLDGGFWAVFTPQGPRDENGYAHARGYALDIADRIARLVQAHPQELAFASKADDAQAIAARGQRVMFLSVENAYPLGEDLSLMSDLQQRGVRMFGLVHTSNNQLADSSTDDKGAEWGGLSPLGKLAVAEANRLGMIVDASHASDAVLEQAIALSKTPVILSHTGCSAVFVHPRNISDALLQKLAASGGVIQINSLGSYLTQLPENEARKAAYKELMQKFGPLPMLDEAGRIQMGIARREIEQKYPAPRASLDDFMRHLLHALQVVGPEHVGIGADWDGGGGVDGMDDVAAIPHITERLLAAGYTREQLSAIWSGNVLRLLRAAEQHASQRAH